MADLGLDLYPISSDSFLVRLTHSCGVGILSAREIGHLKSEDRGEFKFDFILFIFLDVYYIRHMTQFGQHVRDRREKLREEDRRFSLRQVAGRIEVEPAYLSKIERGEVAPPSEVTTVKLARELGEDPDVMLALAGKVSSDLQKIIRKRPKLFADVIRELKTMPDEAILKVVREVRDGNW